MEVLKDDVLEILYKAGKYFIEPEMNENLIHTKGYANYVTHIDYKVQDFLVSELQKILPGSSFITEESEDNEAKLEKFTWIIDPVDGTTNLMYDYHHSAISVGLFKDKRPYMGFIYNPTGEEMFFAEYGHGAWLNGKPIKTSTNRNLAECMIGFGTTPYDRSKAEMTFELVKKLFVNCRDVRRSGSAALDLAYVACGRMDAFFELTLQPWDFAAGMIILNEAGGKLTNWSGQEVDVVYPSSILATNGKVHEEIIKVVNDRKKRI